MFDQTGSYDGGFLLMGGMISLSGLMLYPIPCIKSWLTHNRQTSPPSPPLSELTNLTDYQNI